MAMCGCYCKRDCALLAIIVSVILGVVAAFLQISGVFTVTPVALIVAFGIAVAYLAALVVASLVRRTERQGCCRPLRTVLVGILGTILFSLVLLAVGITATSIVSAILLGLVVGFFTLTLTGTACLVQCATDCAE